MTKDERQELIGQIIDIFEDNLTERDMSVYGSDSNHTTAKIPLFDEDNCGSGVFYGGEHYDKVAAKIEDTLVLWKLIPKRVRLYVKEYNNEWCVSTSPDECYCDEEIWLALGISEDKFYEISRRFNPKYFFHKFDYGNDEKEVCDTSFTNGGDAEYFANALIKESNK